MKTEVRYILELIQERIISIENGIEQIFNLFSDNDRIKFTTEIRYILELIQERTISIENGIEQIFNLFGGETFTQFTQIRLKCSKCGSAMVAEMIEGNWCQRCGWIE